MRRITTISLMLSGLLFCGCKALPTAEEMERWKANVDKSLGAVAAGIDVAQKGADIALAKAKEVDAKLNESADRLEAKGAPVDQGPKAMVEWAKQNPATAWEERAAFLSLLAAQAIGWVRTKKKKDAEVDKKAAEAAQFKQAFTTVVRGVETADPSAAKVVKGNIASKGGKAIDGLVQSALS